jgi:long-chain fatty acid transport protein
MHRFGVSLACVLATATALPSTSRAQGYGVYEQGACTMGRGGTAVSNPCADGSGIYFNPAGIVGRSWSGSLGATLISPGAEFVNDETAIQSSFLDAVYPVPTLYVSGPISNQLAVGLGVFVPYGLTTEWDEDNFEGRFLGYKTTLSAIYIQPTVAARFGNLKVGGGVNFTRLHLQLNRRADLSQVTVASATLPPGTTFGNLGIPFGTDFADTRIDGTAWGVGYNVGAIYDVGTMLSVGARYTSRQKIEAKNAEATFTPVSTGLVLTAGNPFGVPGGTPVDSLVASQFRPGGLLVDQRVSSAIRLPDQLVLGLTVKPIVPLSFSFDAQHTWWKVFDEVPIDFAESDVLDQSLVLGANNVWTLRFGAEYQFANRGRTTVRGGFITHKAALPDSSVTPLLPEGPRNDFTLGVGTGIGRSVYVDVAYMYVNQADRRGRTVGLEQLDGEITNGLFRNQYAHLFGLTVTVDF